MSLTTLFWEPTIRVVDILPSKLQFWDIINKEFIYQSHHLIVNLKYKEIKIVWAHAHVTLQKT